MDGLDEDGVSGRMKGTDGEGEALSEERKSESDDDGSSTMRRDGSVRSDRRR